MRGLLGTRLPVARYGPPGRLFCNGWGRWCLSAESIRVFATKEELGVIFVCGVADQKVLTRSS